MDCASVQEVSSHRSLDPVKIAHRRHVKTDHARFSAEDAVLMSIGFTRRRPAQPRPLERVLWIVRKDARTAHAMLRAHPRGVELRINDNGTLLWSRLFRAEPDAELAPAVDEALQDWIESGWKPVRFDSSAR